MKFKDFSEFFKVLWIFLDFMACFLLVLDFYVSFSVFSMPPRLISIVYKDFFDCWVFLSFSKIFPLSLGSL